MTRRPTKPALRILALLPLAVLSVLLVACPATPGNRAPTANDQAVTTTEDTPVAITLDITDPDGDPLTCTITHDPEHGTLTGTAPNLTYTPDADYTGTDKFTYTTCDGTLTSEEATVTLTITVDDVNEPPVVSIVAPSDGEKWPAVYPIELVGQAVDPEDGDVSADLHWTSSLDGPLGAGSNVDATLRVGTHVITAEVADEEGLVGRAEVGMRATAYLWTHMLTLGTDEGVVANDIASDAHGNLYIAGMTVPAVGNNRDLFLAKYDSQGNRMWTRQHGTGEDDAALAVAVDSQNNVYVAGFTYGNLDGYTNTGDSDVVLMKYDADGTRQWTRVFGSSEDHPTQGAFDIATGIAIDADDSIFIAGDTSGSLPGYTNVGSGDVFLAKYNPSGTASWTLQWGPELVVRATGLDVDPNGDLVIGGTQNSQDVMVLKFDGDGNELWSRILDSGLWEESLDLVTNDASEIFVTGYTSGAFDGSNAGDNDIFLLKFDGAGTLRWARQHGSTSNETGRSVVELNGYVYVAGVTGGDLGDNRNLGGDDLVLVKYGNDGSLVWTSQIGVDGLPSFWAWAVTTCLTDSLYVVGHGYDSVSGESGSILVEYTP